MSKKNLVDKIKQKYIQKKNWARKRFNYMNGIHSYHRQQNLKSRKTIFSSLLKTKLYEQEDSVCLEDVEFLKELIIDTEDEFSIKLTNIINNISNNSILKEDFELILCCFHDLISVKPILESNESLTDIFLGRNKMSKRPIDRLFSLVGLDEMIIDNTPMIVNDDSEKAAIDMMYDDDLSNMNNIPASNITGVYDFKNKTSILDRLSLYLEDELIDYGVKNVHVEIDEHAVYFDLNFSKKDSLTFAMYINPTTKPVIECRADDAKGAEEFLPYSYMDNHMLEIRDDFEKDFPIAFVISCIKNFAPDEYLIKESQLDVFNYMKTSLNLNEARFRKVMRHGIYKWVKKIPKRYRHKKLSFAQRVALNLARKKAHTTSAERRRRISVSKGKRLKLYKRPIYSYHR